MSLFGGLSGEDQATLATKLAQADEIKQQDEMFKRKHEELDQLRKQKLIENML